MPQSHEVSSEKTYRAIGRFVFEFSQVEYTIRVYLAEELGLHEDYFKAVVQSYDVALLCKVAKEVFSKSRANMNAAAINNLISKFLELNEPRNRLAHGLWVPFKDGGTVHHVSRNSFKSIDAANQAEKLEELANELSNLRGQLDQEFYNLVFTHKL